MPFNGKFMSALHWKIELLHRSGQNLLPRFLPLEVLIYVARKMALYKDGALDRHELEAMWSFLTFWVEKLVDAQDAGRLHLVQKSPERLLPQLVDELDLWVRLELVSRQIDYPIYDLTVATLFQTQFSEVTRC
jgi:hypothetical protein